MRAMYLALNIIAGIFKMNTQEREIKLLNKILDSQGETIKIYQESIIPLYELRIKNLENQLKEK